MMYGKTNKSRRSPKVLSEQHLHDIIRRCVRDTLNENQGIVDGIKGAWNGFKGGLGTGHAKFGIGQGYKQGAQEQQDVITNMALDMVHIYLMNLDDEVKRALALWHDRENGSVDFMASIKKVYGYCKKIEKEMQRKATDGVDYKEKGVFYQK